MKFLQCIYKHLHGNRRPVPPRHDSKDSERRYVALHHFPPAILQYNNHGHFEIIDNTTAESLGFMASDKLPSEFCLECGFFPAPSFTTDPMLRDLAVAERTARLTKRHDESSAALKHKTTLRDCEVSSSRRTPEELERQRVRRMVDSRPDKATDAIIETRKENAELKLQIAQLINEKKLLQQDIDRLNEKLEKVGVVSSFAGLTRVTVSSDAWHEANSSAANFLFGLKEWKYTKVYLTKALFPGLEIVRPGVGDMSDFESALSVLMHWHGGLKQELVALIYGVDPSTITRKVQKWGPKFQRVGRMLSNLDLDLTFDFLSAEDCAKFGLEHYSTADKKDEYSSYLDASRPKEFKDGGSLETVSLLVDGKDIQTDSIRVHSGVNILMFSEKSDASAGRVLSWILPDGLNVYNTGLYLGRVSEERLVELHGTVDSNNIRLVPED